VLNTFSPASWHIIYRHHQREQAIRLPPPTEATAQAPTLWGFKNVGTKKDTPARWRRIQVTAGKRVSRANEGTQVLTKIAVTAVLIATVLSPVPLDKPGGGGGGGGGGSTHSPKAPGNGGGPTRCENGGISGSGGKGTCSHNGGEG
jgi:hypothetical protein